MDVRKAGVPKDYTAIAKQYAEAVVPGEVAGAKWVRLACQRQLDDLKRFNPTLTDKTGRKFRPADNLCAFAERLPHVKGPLAGQAIELA
jgi:phage terminase large subunit-like protein